MHTKTYPAPALYQLRLGRQRQVRLIPIADERVGVHCTYMPYLGASAVVIHYEEALYQVYAPLPSFHVSLLTLTIDAFLDLT